MQKDKKTTKLLEQLDIHPEQIDKQVSLLKQKISTRYQDKIFDGLLNELAETKLILNFLLMRIKNIDNKIQIYDINLPEFLPIYATTSELKIDAGFPLSPTQGFYHPEYDSNGQQFRWTGPEDYFYFDVFLDRHKPIELVLRLITAVVPENINGLRCFVDEIEIFLKQDKVNDIFELRGVLPKRDAFGSTKISFRIPKPSKPSDLYSDNAEDRILGVAFSQLILKPIETFEA
jgi:hypothetical protein